MDQGIVSIRDQDRYLHAVPAFAGEVIGVDPKGTVAALHHAGDEIWRMQRLVAAGEDRLHRLPVAAGEPRHPWRMDVQLPQPLNPRQGAQERAKYVICVLLIVRIMSRLMRRLLARSDNGKRYGKRRFSGRKLQAAAEELDAGLQPRWS